MNAFSPIARKSNLPQAALDWFSKNNLTPPTENRLEIVNVAENSVEINLLGSVGNTWDETGITEKELRNALDQAKGKKILLNINSPGGYVNEGLGLYNAVNSRKADITAKITGYALSAASFFPLAASKVISPASSIWMIHPAQWIAMGSASDLRKTADALEVHDESIIGIYCKKTGKPATEIKAAMEKETWMTGAEAIAFGLAEADPDEDDDSANNLAAVNSATPTTPATPAAKPQNGVTPPVVATPTTNSHVTTLPLLSPATTTPPANQHQHPTPNHMPETNTPAAASTAAHGDALAQVQAQLATERRARITDLVTRKAENRIKNDNLNWWIEAAMKDEAGVIAQIDAMPSAHVGSEPLGAGRIELGGAPVLAGFGEKPTVIVENIFKTHSTPLARYEAVKNNFAAAMAEANRKDGCRPGVMNANSYSGTLTTNFLVMGATVKLGPKFAALGAFSRDVSVDPYKPLATGVMKFTTSVQDGTDVQTNATDFTTGDSTVTAVSISVAQYTASANLTNGDLNSGIRMEDIALPKLRSLGSKLMQVALAPVTTANFTATPLVAALNPASFGFNEARQLYATLKYASTRNLILDTEYTAGLLNQPVFFQKSIEQQSGAGHWTNIFGWDNIYENTEWTGAGSGVHGFACDPQAIGVIQGLPLIDGSGIPGGILSVSTGTIPGCNVPIAAVLWFDTNKRTYYMSYDTMLGAAKLDATAGVIIKNS